MRGIDPYNISLSSLCEDNRRVDAHIIPYPADGRNNKYSGAASTQPSASRQRQDKLTAPRLLKQPGRISETA
jgi:hypothetical protein